MDRDGPDTPVQGGAGDHSSGASVAPGVSARVGAILAKAEARAQWVRQQAERSASETRRTARHESERIADDARGAAEAAARDRVRRISELRASIAARGGSLVEGLEGGELTAARLDELVAALGEAADRVSAEIGSPAPAGRAPAPARAPSERAPGDRLRVPTEPVGSGVPGQELPQPSWAGGLLDPPGRTDPVDPPPGSSEADASGAVRDGAIDGDGASDGDGDGDGAGKATPISDPLPDGAPIVRRPARTNARFAAVLMAIQGRDRHEVAERLAREHGLADPQQLLDDVFGRADAPA